MENILYWFGGISDTFYNKVAARIPAGAVTRIVPNGYSPIASFAETNSFGDSIIDGVNQSQFYWCQSKIKAHGLMLCRGNIWCEMAQLENDDKESPKALV